MLAMNYKTAITFGALAALLSVALGAFGSHGLENVLNEKQHKTYETAARYQMYHAIALLFVGLLLKNYSNKLLNISALLFAIGIFIFSGSLYLLVALQAKGYSSFNIIGAITPLGGLCFIFGWLCLALSIKKI
jgi:uncharacterized membrane protein YgdD (TMEM256/DUF423 family)